MYIKKKYFEFYKLKKKIFADGKKTQKLKAFMLKPISY